MARQASDLDVLTSANAGSSRWLRVDVPANPRMNGQQSNQNKWCSDQSKMRDNLPLLTQPL